MVNGVTKVEKGGNATSGKSLKKIPIGFLLHGKIKSRKIILHRKFKFSGAEMKRAHTHTRMLCVDLVSALVAKYFSNDGDDDDDLTYK